jgi:hypothetical protein
MHRSFATSAIVEPMVQIFALKVAAPLTPTWGLLSCACWGVSRERKERDEGLFYVLVLLTCLSWAILQRKTKSRYWTDSSKEILWALLLLLFRMLVGNKVYDYLHYLLVLLLLRQELWRLGW